MTGYASKSDSSELHCMRTISREDVVVEDIHSKIQRYNVPLAIRMFKTQGSYHKKQNMNLDFIGNCQKWCDQKLVGLFGPDIAFADVVLIGQLPELKKNIPNALIKRFKSGLSDAEVAFYYYRYHLACVRHKSDVRTLRSPRTRQRRIYPFVVEEFPNDPTNKLLTVKLDHPNINLPKDQQCGKPNVTLLFELIAALAAWAFQTDHAIAPSRSILKILLQTQGTESEFDYFRSRLAQQNMRIYTPEELMDEARGWIGEDLSFEVVDDLLYIEEDKENGEFSRASSLRMSMFVDQSLFGQPQGRGNGSRVSYRSTADKILAQSNVESSRRLSRRSLEPSTGRRVFVDPDMTASASRATLDLQIRSTTSQIMNAPAVPGGTSNPPIKMDREFDQYWPDLGFTVIANETGLIRKASVDGKVHQAQVSEEDHLDGDGLIRINIKSKEHDDAISDHQVLNNCCKIS